MAHPDRHNVMVFSKRPTCTACRVFAAEYICVSGQTEISKEIRCEQLLCKSCACQVTQKQGTKMPKKSKYHYPVNGEGNIDWVEHHRQQVATGRICSCCASIILRSTDTPQRCFACEQAELNDTEIDHESYVRCPACNEHIRPEDDHDMYNEGENAVCCERCDYEFDVTTSISYTFTSPPRLSEEERKKRREDYTTEMGEDYPPIRRG